MKKFLDRLATLFSKRTWTYRNHSRLNNALAREEAYDRQYADQAAARIQRQEHETTIEAPLPQESYLLARGEARTGEVNRRLSPTTEEQATVCRSLGEGIARIPINLHQPLAEAQSKYSLDLEEEKARHERDLEELDTRTNEATEQVEKETETLDTIRKEGDFPAGSPPFRFSQKVLTTFLLMATAAGEAATYYRIFEARLRDSGTVALLMAGGLSAAFIGLAHYAGKAVGKLTTGKWARWGLILKASLALFIAGIAAGTLRVFMGNSGVVIPDSLEGKALATLAVFLPVAAFYVSAFAFDPLQLLKRAYNKQLRVVRKSKHDLSKSKADRALAIEQYGVRTQALHDRYYAKRAELFEEAAQREQDLRDKLATHSSVFAWLDAGRRATLANVSAETAANIHYFRGKLIESGAYDQMPQWMERPVTMPPVSDVNGVSQDGFIPENRDPESKVKQNGQSAHLGRKLLGIGLLFLTMCLSSCSESSADQKEPYDAAIEILADRTDTSLTRTVPLDAPGLLRTAGLQSGKDDCGTGSVHVTLNEISDSAFELPHNVQLSAAGRSNPYDNCDSVRAFIPRVQEELDSLFRPLNQDAAHSRIYYPLCSALQRLREHGEGKRIIIVLSDFLENTPELSFYTEGIDALNDHPAEIETRLEAQCELPDQLHGITVYLITTPSKEDGALVLAARRFFTRWLERRGARVHQTFTQ